jgi:heptaprenylglyceryl phosphate synthase
LNIKMSNTCNKVTVEVISTRLSYLEWSITLQNYVLINHISQHPQWLHHHLVVGGGQ